MDINDFPLNVKDVLEGDRKFNALLGINNVAELNVAVEQRSASDLINICETRQAKSLSVIADDIAMRRARGDAGIVLIAGPSSSGKTTTCKRLANQMLINYIRPKMISLDDYFVNRVDTPRDESGEYDYESLYALDLDLFKSHLAALLAGEEINIPTYSFELGERVNRDRPLKLNSGEVLIVEGIHGLNPELTAGIPSNYLYKIFASALPSISDREGVLISPTDDRLLRRIVRDNKYRHVSAEGTLKRWGSVRRGEDKWILPYAAYADSVFNTSLLYEIGAIKSYALPLLMEVRCCSPEYLEAQRLISFLEQFNTVPSDKIPPMSLLREFLGGSSFHY